MSITETQTTDKLIDPGRLSFIQAVYNPHTKKAMDSEKHADSIQDPSIQDSKSKDND